MTEIVRGIRRINSFSYFILSRDPPRCLRRREIPEEFTEFHYSNESKLHTLDLSA